VHGVAPDLDHKPLPVASTNPADLGGWNTWKNWVQEDSSGQTTNYLYGLGVPNIRPSQEDPNNPNYYDSDARAQVSAFGSYQNNAEQVDVQINKVLTRYGVAKVNVLTHSMGGLDASYAAIGDGSKIANLVMLAVPYAGTPLADALVGGPCAFGVAFDNPIASIALDLCTYVIENFSPGAEQLTRTYWLGYQAFHDGSLLPPNPSIDYFTVAGKNPGVSVGPIQIPEWFAKAFYLGADSDGIVPVDSVKAAPATFLGVVGYNHFDITNHKDVSDLVAPYLGLPPARPVAGSISGQARARATLSAAGTQPHFGPGLLGTVAPASTVTRTFAVASSSDLNTFLMWDQDTLQMTLIDPSGHSITPLNSSAQYTQTLNSGGGGGLDYELSNPSSGLWTAVITNTNSQGQSAHFLLGTSFLSTIAIIPPAAATYQPGTTAPISITLADAGISIAGATITATASLSGTAPVTITLTNAGQGVYSGDFGVLATPGEYTINLVATGTDKGAPFALTGLAFFTVATGNASFAGAYAEGATPGDFGLYSSLIITPAIQVNAAGTYSLHGTLTDAAGDVIGTAGVTAGLSAGASQSLALSFDGKTVGATGKDGPYQLRDLTLTDDSSGSVLTDDEVPLAYTTAPYVAAQFARPLIQILPGTQDMGTNPNAKGQFQNLTVSFTATGALNDSYQVAATLASAQGQYITAVTQSVRLSSAPTQVALQFSGADIAALGIDGPYYVTGVTVVPDSSPTTYVSYPSLWTTQAYSAASFAPPSMTPTNTPVPPTATSANTFAPPAATPTNTAVPPVATATNTPVPPAAPTSMPNPPVIAPTNTAVPPSALPTTAPASGVTTSTPSPTNTVAHSATITHQIATSTPISRVAGVTRTQATCVRPAVTRVLVNGKTFKKGTQLLSGQMVAVGVRAAPRMRVQTLIDLMHTVTTTTGTGRHRKTVKRTVVVGHVATTATTNSSGNAMGYARIAYVPATAATVALRVDVRAACGGSATLASSAMRLTPAYVTPIVSVSLPNGKPLAGATIQTNSTILVRVDAAENTPIKIAVTLHVQGSKESVTYTAPSNARQAEPRTGKLDGYLMEQVRIPYEPRQYKVAATLTVSVSARSTVGKKQRTLTATTGALHVTLQSERPPQRVRHH